MASPDLIAPIITALEKVGVAVLQDEKTQLEAFIEPMADADANAIVLAIATHINMNGLAGMVAPAFRNALIGSEPTIDNVINANINSGFEDLEALMSGLASAHS